MKTNRIFIPPNGFAGGGQQTQANQLVPAASGMGRTVRKRRKTKAATKRKATRAPARKRSSSRRAKPARLVKGSAAAKRYMAKIRRKRKR